MAELRRELVKSLDLELMDYKELLRKIAERKVQLEMIDCHPLKFWSEMLDKSLIETELQNLELRLTTINLFFKYLDEEDKEIALLRWKKEKPWAEIEAIIHVSEPTMRRKKKKLIKKYARLKGLA